MFCSVGPVLGTGSGGGGGIVDCLGDDIMGFPLLSPIKTVIALPKYFLLRGLLLYVY